MTQRELWSRLVAAGCASGEAPAHESQGPWYVRLMLGIAGCIAAGFLMGFVGVGLSFLVDSKLGSIAAGIAMIGAAFALLHAARTDFSAMFGFAVSLAGQALLAYGIARVFERTGDAVPWAAMALIEALLAIAMPNFVHRLVSGYLAALCLASALAVSGGAGLAAGVIAAGIAYAWLGELRRARLHETVTAVGYGMALAFIQAQSWSFHEGSMIHSLGAKPISWAQAWTGQALVLAAFLVVVATLVRRAGWSLREPRALAALVAAAAIGAASFKAPGVAGGLMIVSLGFAHGNRVLTGVGIAALLFFISSYYYLLDVTLLAKAGVLAASGVVLLAVRWLLLKVILEKDARA
jgi:uncharacterized membrane protein